MCQKSWTVIEETTPSGKQLFQCSGCGVRDPAPTKNHSCVLVLQYQLAPLRARVAHFEATFELLDQNVDIAHTYFWDEHPEDYDKPCLCAVCRSYMDG